MKQYNTINTGSLQVMIPTRNSGAWLKLFLERYRKYDIDPIYIVDARTNDNTIEILDRNDVSYHVFEPSANYAESGLIEFGSLAICSEWILRLDDDEFPNEVLIDWIKSGIFYNECSCWGIQRFDLSNIDNKIQYSLWPARFERQSGYRIYNPQLRLFKPNCVRFLTEVHTPGFEITEVIKFAPKNCFIAHFNNILRSPNERLQKVIQYSYYNKQRSWKVIDEALPELFEKDIHRYSSNGLDEFYQFADSLPKPYIKPLKICNENEILYSIRESTHWLANSSRAMLEDVIFLQNLIDPFIIFIPPQIIKKIAELMLTLSSIIKSEKIYKKGSNIWKLYEYRNGMDYRNV